MVFLGLDEVKRTLVAAGANKDMELWENRFKITGRHTVETTVINMRVILTDDPENIRAVLASQFHDYGMFVGS